VKANTALQFHLRSWFVDGLQIISICCGAAELVSRILAAGAAEPQCAAMLFLYGNQMDLPAG
jgi:hypothetical protein